MDVIMLEIERKWRLEKLPDCCLHENCFINSLRIEIDQGYIFEGPSSLRLRKSCTKSHRNYTMTVKGSGNLARAEWETEIPKWVFDCLWKKVNHSLFKDRFKVPSADYVFEFDEYKLKLSGLLILECEFNQLKRPIPLCCLIGSKGPLKLQKILDTRTAIWPNLAH